MKNILLIATMCIVAYTSISDTKAQTVPLDDTFNYQGELLDNGTPANGNYDITIQAFGFLSGGTPVYDLSTHLNVPVTNGLFTLDNVDLGGASDGYDLYLEVSVRANGGGSYTALSPRQKVKAVPYANSLTTNGATSGQVLTYSFDKWLPATPSNHTTPSPWVSTGANISFSTGNVGIGTSPPTAFKLEVDGKSTFTDDISQNLSKGGTIKYMVRANCGMSGSAISRQFDGANTSILPISISNGGTAGRCTITFPANVNTRYWSVTPDLDANRSANCKISANATALNCRAFDPTTGAGATTPIMVIVY